MLENPALGRFFIAEAGDAEYQMIIAEEGRMKKGELVRLLRTCSSSLVVFYHSRILELICVFLNIGSREKGVVTFVSLGSGMRNQVVCQMLWI